MGKFWSWWTVETNGPARHGLIWRLAPAHTVSTLERVGQGDGDPVAEAGGEVQLGAAARAGGAEAEASPHQGQDQHRSSHHDHTVACYADPVPLSNHSHFALVLIS